MFTFGFSVKPRMKGKAKLWDIVDRNGISYKHFSTEDEANRGLYDFIDEMQREP